MTMREVLLQKLVKHVREPTIRSMNNPCLVGEFRGMKLAEYEQGLLAGRIMMIVWA